MAMRIDKACAENACVELGRRERVQLLPLLEAHDAFLVVESNDGVWHDAATIDQKVCCDAAHSYWRAPSSMAWISVSEKMRILLCSLKSISTHFSRGGV